MNTIRSKTAVSSQRRAALWSLGLVGSSSTGFNILLEFDGFIEYLTNEVLSCETLSMRGTCFYIIGLLSITSKGRHTLSQLGWEFSVNESLGIAFPKDLSKLLKVPDSKFVGSWQSSPQRTMAFGVSTLQRLADTKLNLPDRDEDFIPLILAHISSLVNNVTRKTSQVALRR